MRREGKLFRWGSSLCLLACWVACRSAPVARESIAEAPGAPAPTVAFIGVTVLPMGGAPALENGTVVVSGTRITAVGPAATTPVPAGATRVEGHGRYLMPGLVDMHLHLHKGTGEPGDTASQQMALLLANGVTTARSLGGAPTGLALRERLKTGEVRGPRLLLAGPSLHGGSVKGPEQARQKVREQKAAGYDLLKTHGGLDRETYDAMVDEARAQGLRVSGHVTPEVGLPHALASGQQVEHLDGYLAMLLPPGDPSSFGQIEFTDALDRMDAARIPAVAEATRKAGVWSSPTLALFELLSGTPDEATLRAWPELRYVPAATVEKWAQALKDPELAGGTDARRQRFLELRRQVVRGLHAAGAPLMVGSDSPQIFMVSGFAVHREMEAMAAAGLPTSVVLEAATHTPAEYLGEADAWGAVKPGLRADLLLLDADPRADVRNTRALSGVMVRGQWMPRAELEALLKSVEAATGRGPG